MIIVNGNNAVLGRMASYAAKKLLSGDEVTVINAEKIIITGDPKNTVVKYLERLKKGSPQHGPFFPRKPELFVRRAIRGMMPYKTLKGRKAFKKLRVYVSVPDEFKGKESVNMEKEIKTNFITIEKLVKSIGWNK
ncbi:MAG: 50S ribosomal protein L13 [Candidatus Aenigmatarchaeota archaeon]